MLHCFALFICSKLLDGPFYQSSVIERGFKCPHVTLLRQVPVVEGQNSVGGVIVRTVCWIGFVYVVIRLTAH